MQAVENGEVERCSSATVWHAQEDPLLQQKADDFNHLIKRKGSMIYGYVQMSIDF